MFTAIWEWDPHAKIDLDRHWFPDLLKIWIPISGIQILSHKKSLSSRILIFGFKPTSSIELIPLLVLRVAHGQGRDERVQVPRPGEVDTVEMHEFPVSPINYLTLLIRRFLVDSRMSFRIGFGLNNLGF